MKAGRKSILDGLSLDIYRNRVNTIVGPSGGGKSTLLKCLNRLIDLDQGMQISGTVIFDGKDIHEYREIDLRRQIGFVFQKPNPFPLSVYENVAFGIRAQGSVRKEEMDILVKVALEEAGLYDEVKDNLKTSAMTLSGGQQQRLCIARALILKPQVLMMDEPTSALDPVSRGRIEDMIIRLKEKYTVILVTHDMNQARRLSDYTNLLYRGKIIASGMGTEFLESEAEEVKSFLGGSV